MMTVFISHDVILSPPSSYLIAAYKFLVVSLLIAFLSFACNL